MPSHTDNAASNPLPTAFFEQPTLAVAQGLIGRSLCRKLSDKTLRLTITEVEAYDGPKDKASHAHRGCTPRNAVMFGPAGRWYVYLCYGVHWLLNIVTGPVDYPAAILLRGAGKLQGPGRLTKALGVDQMLNEQEATPSTGLWIESNGSAVNQDAIARLPRIGIDYAGPIWAQKP